MSPAASWARALELTAPIASHPERTLPVVLQDLADRQGDAPALLADDERLTFAELLRRSNQYARWALDRRLDKGDVVALLMPNRPEYMAIWLGITSIGGTVALLNTNVRGGALAHCIDAVAARLVIADASLLDRIGSDVIGRLGRGMVCVHGASPAATPYMRLDREVERISDTALTAQERRGVTIDEHALWIYTSGTTGLPKAASVSHARLMQWSHWFAGMMNVQPADRMYNCLPMYHSVGGVLATGAVLVGGGSVAIRESFSARQFWHDVIRWDCTLFQYVGELCRYLVHAELVPEETRHRIRIACGNGLRGDIWERFVERFHIPRILEFYASTEGNVSLFNVEGKPGAVGRIPGFLRHRSPLALVHFDFESEQPVRDERGRCVRCAPHETGEALGPIARGDRANIGSRYEGYTSAEATERKILRDVFEPGDAWFRTGDLMRMDEQGFFYFVDRIGDTFRWKGENVSTTEVSAAICEHPGVQHAVVYGVAVPNAEGRAGMAAIVPDESVDLEALRRHLADRLPSYARPLFIRLCDAVEVTRTLKHSKLELVRGGYDPTSTDDPIYLNPPTGIALRRLDADLFERIQGGRVRL